MALSDICTTHWHKHGAVQDIYKLMADMQATSFNLTLTKQLKF